MIIASILNTIFGYMAKTVFKFLSIGNAFDGGTSAFVKLDNLLIIMDPGENFYANFRKYEKAIMKNIKNVIIIITHTHSDHIGSFGTAVFKFYEQYKITPVVVFPSIDKIKEIARIFGIEDKIYCIEPNKLNDEINNLKDDEENKGLLNITPIKVKHTDRLECYAYLIKLKRRTVFYSGDLNQVPKEVIDAYLRDEIKEMYIEATLDKSLKCHNYLDNLLVIPKQYRKNVYIMHIDFNTKIVKKARKLGFSISSLYHGTKFDYIKKMIESD